MMMFSPPLSPPLRARGGVGVNCKKNNQQHEEEEEEEEFLSFCHRQ